MKGEQKESYDPNTLQDLLPIYYKRLFPHIHFYRWLSYGSSAEDKIFCNREISFTLEDDIYVRYLSFETQTEMEKEICYRIPFKIDIGAVMSFSPKNQRLERKMEPVQRELVFDIDMTDYDDVRTCCSGAEVCPKCWKYMTVACRIVDTALREDFGFEHILWVFSGRRGIHCWVCDKTARYLGTKTRAAVAEYFQIVVHGGDHGKIKVALGEKIHHSIKRALKLIEPFFEEVCVVEQNLFGAQSGVNKLLQLISDENVRKDVEVYLKGHEGSSKGVWDAFVRYINSLRVQGTLPRKMKNIIEEIQLVFMYPRLDINVTKGLNHLLKAPFCIHPKTGKVCVPFNPNAAAKFDLNAVPTINMLLEEINVFDDKNKSEDAADDRSKIKDYKKTGMLKGLVVFEEFLRKLESSYKRKAVEVSDQKMEV